MPDTQPFRCGDRVLARGFGELHVLRTQTGSIVECSDGPDSLFGLHATDLTLIEAGTPDSLPADVQAWAGAFDRLVREGARLLGMEDGFA